LKRSKSSRKAIIGLAGEYMVASQICRLDYFAQITYGRWKNVDIIAVNPERKKHIN